MKKRRWLKEKEEENPVSTEAAEPDPVEAGRGMLKSGGRVLKALAEDRKAEAKR